MPTLPHHPVVHIPSRTCPFPLHINTSDTLADKNAGLMMQALFVANEFNRFEYRVMKFSQLCYWRVSNRELTKPLCSHRYVLLLKTHFGEHPAPHPAAIKRMLTCLEVQPASPLPAGATGLLLESPRNSPSTVVVASDGAARKIKELQARV
jgi:hypothetical protein